MHEAGSDPSARCAPTARGRRQCRFATIPAGLLLLLLAAPLPALAAGSKPDAAPDEPVWTLKPTRVDRQKDTRQRIEPAKPADDRISLYADHPIRLRPDGSFSAGGQMVRIYGMELPPRSRICEPPSGGRWACGVRANAFFISRLAAGRPLLCRPRSAEGAEVMLADCAVAGRDLAREMIGGGWATADALADASLKAVEAEAKAKGLGLWRQTPPDF